VLASLVSAAPQITPTIVRIVKTPPTKELSVVDLILSGLGLTGLILLCALVVGVALGGLFIWFKTIRPQNPLNGQASQTHGLQLDHPSRQPEEAAR
jgi:hypothetical protein